jgi:hypothetical protein
MAIVDMDYGVVGYTGSVEEAEEPARKNMRSRAETLPKNLIARLPMHTISTWFQMPALPHGHARYRRDGEY